MNLTEDEIVALRVVNSHKVYRRPKCDGGYVISGPVEPHLVEKLILSGLCQWFENGNPDEVDLAVLTHAGRIRIFESTFSNVGSQMRDIYRNHMRRGDGVCK